VFKAASRCLWILVLLGGSLAKVLGLITATAENRTAIAG
jgi:hypothetical protein